MKNEIFKADGSDWDGLIIFPSSHLVYLSDLGINLDPLEDLDWDWYEIFVWV